MLEEDVVAALVAQLTQHSGGSMPTQACMRMLYKDHPEAQAIVEGVGGPKALCTKHGILEFIADGDADGDAGCIRLVQSAEGERTTAPANASALATTDRTSKQHDHTVEKEGKREKKLNTEAAPTAGDEHNEDHDRADGKERLPEDAGPEATRSGVYVTVKATTQDPLLTSRRGTGDAHINVCMYVGPYGNVVTRVGDPVGVFQLSSDAVPMVIKIQGNEDDLIKKNSCLQFYNKDRSVSGWIQASMNSTGEFKDAYTLICDTIMQFGDAGRVCGMKGYFEAVVQRNMEVKVNCGNLVRNIEW